MNHVSLCKILNWNSFDYQTLVLTMVSIISLSVLFIINVDYQIMLSKVTTLPWCIRTQLLLAITLTMSYNITIRIIFILYHHVIWYDLEN